MSPFSKPKREVAPVPQAILFTDIVGSTQYFSARGDEAGLRMLERHNRHLFPVVEQASGRVVKTIGDSILAVFDQPGDALVAAFAMQQRLSDVCASFPPEDQIYIRVGVHYGLVTEKGNDVFGDAVNLAERVKSLADSGQILVSRTLRDMVRADPRFALHSIGYRSLKGAEEPMELFELTAAPALPSTSLLQRWTQRSTRTLRSHPRIVATGLALLVISGLWSTRLVASDFLFPERLVLPTREEITQALEEALHPGTFRWGPAGQVEERLGSGQWVEKEFFEQLESGLVKITVSEEDGTKKATIHITYPHFFVSSWKFVRLLRDVLAERIRTERRFRWRSYEADCAQVKIEVEGHEEIIPYDPGSFQVGEEYFCVRPGQEDEAIYRSCLLDNGEIFRMQEILKELGYYDGPVYQELHMTDDEPPDCDFQFEWEKSPVEEALEEFQRAHGLEADGVFGRNTRAAFRRAIQEQDRQR